MADDWADQLTLANKLESATAGKGEISSREPWGFWYVIESKYRYESYYERLVPQFPEIYVFLFFWYFNILYTI